MATNKIIKNLDGKALKEVLKRMEYINKHSVYVGVPSDGSGRKDGESNAIIAAAHEFGATIKHPGGTRYTKRDGAKATFNSNSFMGPVSGTTKSHTIVLPERSYLRSTLNENGKKYAEIEARELAKSLKPNGPEPEKVLNQLGLMVSSDVKKRILDGNFAPLKRATIKRKGSTKPLTDTGAMMQSITWRVKRD